MLVSSKTIPVAVLNIDQLIILIHATSPAKIVAGPALDSRDACDPMQLCSAKALSPELLKHTPKTSEPPSRIPAQAEPPKPTFLP